MKKTKIIFMGTPDFAVPVLKTLNDNYDVVAVVTKADKPKGRGGKMAESEVAVCASALGLVVLKPENVRTPEFTEELKGYSADFFVTAAYGKILPESVLKVPKYGCVNVHASLLPEYRGAAPIWRAVMDGARESGVTTMLTDVGMDTGDILLSKSVEITENMTTGELHDELSKIGCELIVKSIDGILEGSLKPVPQAHDRATYAPMVSREDGLIDWNSTSGEIHNKVRGCDPFPGAFTFCNGQRLKVWQTRLCGEDISLLKEGKKPGSIIKICEEGIFVVTGDGVIRITQVQVDNSKRMDVRSFLNGHSLEAEVLG